MREHFLTLLRGLTGSKKAMVALSSIIAITAAKVGLDLDVELVLGLAGVVAAYLLAQGRADQGKEAAKLERPPKRPPGV